VLPTECLTNVFHLTGRQIAVAYGFIFNFVQAAQFAICVALAWRRHSGLLIFLIAEYAFAGVLGFGFMSEVLIGPGFFWICLFLAMRRPFPLAWFAISFAGLVFSHELMLTSAVMVAVFAWSQRERCRAGVESWLQGLGRLLVCVTIFFAWITVRFSGGGSDADRNPLTTLDPRRILDNPTLWLVIMVVALIVIGWSSDRPIRRRWSVLITAACVAIPIMLEPWLNFAQGRYDSARTLVGLELLLFGGWAILAHMGQSLQRRATENGSVHTMLPLILSATLAVNIGASAAFLWDWVNARQGFERLIRRDIDVAAPRPSYSFVTYQDAQSLLTPAEVISNDRMGFGWTWPFRSLVLAQGYSPVRIIVEPESLYKSCIVMRGMHLNEGSVPADIIQDYISLACAATPAPARRGFVGRVFDQFKSVF
jgi:hypothetical protein